jgi:hypothetical protein
MEAVPTWDALNVAYGETVTRLLDKWSIKTASMPSIQLTDVFAQATEKQLLFGKEGVNFQDVVILHSVIERLAGTQDKGVLVTDDGNFHNRMADWTEYAKEKGASLSVMKLDESEEFFRNQLDDKEKQHINHQQALARQAVDLYLPTFEKTFNDSLQSQARNPLDGLHDAHFTEVADVDIAGEAPSSNRVRLSAIVRGKVLETVVASQALRIDSYVHPIEVGFTALARVHEGRFEIESVDSATYGWPSVIGSIGHPRRIDSL